MALSHVISGAVAGADLPVVRRISTADVWQALREGVDDFAAMPSHAIFLIVIYPVIGLAAARLVLGYDVLPLLFPLAAGFALVGPFAALGLYELSRRREQGLDVSWQRAIEVRHCPSFGAIVSLGLGLMVVFLVWLTVAQSLYVAAFGWAPAAEIPDFVGRIFTTPEGWMLIILGNLIGFFFALAVLTVSVVSFPLLLDRDVGVAAAVLTSVKAVVLNPVPMALWGLIVAVSLLIGSIPLFFGLAVALPILGHATWHLYRKVVAPEPARTQPMERAPAPKLPPRKEPPEPFYGD